MHQVLTVDDTYETVGEINQNVALLGDSRDDLCSDSDECVNGRLYFSKITCDMIA